MLVITQNNYSVFDMLRTSKCLSSGTLEHACASLPEDDNFVVRNMSKTL
jgi:hypothetical protein